MDTYRGNGGDVISLVENLAGKAKRHCFDSKLIRTDIIRYYQRNLIGTYLLNLVPTYLANNKYYIIIYNACDNTKAFTQENIKNEKLAILDFVDENS